MVSFEGEILNRLCQDGPEQRSVHGSSPSKVCGIAESAVRPSVAAKNERNIFIRGSRCGLMGEQKSAGGGLSAAVTGQRDGTDPPRRV